MERIDADVLIPGLGQPTRDACLVLDGGRIAHAGASAGAPKPPAAAASRRVPVLMPGLWECHGHFVGLKGTSLEDLLRVPMPVGAVRAAKDAERVLRAGFTRVREAGGLRVHLARPWRKARSWGRRSTRRELC
jgi:imidazolonepropionase-like amidohydrolase